MKKSVCFLMMILLLAGCAARETFETVSDTHFVPVSPQPGIICVDLPGETALPVMENDSGRIYLCSDYEILLQTLPAGDLEATLNQLCGLSPEEVTLVETREGDLRRWDFVWAAAGETGDQAGRAAILDDGSHHYCLSVLRSPDEQKKSQICWDQVFSSFSVAAY